MPKDKQFREFKGIDESTCAAYADRTTGAEMVDIVELSIHPNGHWMSIQTTWLSLPEARKLGEHLIRLSRGGDKNET